MPNHPLLPVIPDRRAIAVIRTETADRAMAVGAWGRIESTARKVVGARRDGRSA